MDDFREPPPDQGNWGSGDDNQRPGEPPPQDSNAHAHSNTEPSRPDASEGGDAADLSNGAGRSDSVPSDSAPSDMDHSEESSEARADVEGDSTADALRGELGRIVDDSCALAEAEASRLRHLHAMLQNALAHPDVFIEVPRGTTRDDLTGDAEGWVRSSLAQEIGAAIGVTKAHAAALLYDAEELCELLPATVEALENGQITRQHADAMLRQTSELDADGVAQFESAALPAALEQSPTQFRRSAVKIRAQMFPETIAERTNEAAKKRRVDCYGTHDGMGALTLYAPIEVVQSLANATRLTARALKAAGDDRTLAQIEADTLVDALMVGFTADTDHKPGVGAAGVGAKRLGGIRPTVYVTVPVMTLLGHSDEPAHLDGYGPLDPETARRLAAQAPSFTRLLTHPETGAVLSVGRHSYAVPADLRRAVELRDETCIGIGCDRAATTCDIDHNRDWQHGGETRFDNLTPMCEPHHMVKHHTLWRITRTATGELDWVSPLGFVYRVPRTSNVQFVSVDDDNARSTAAAERDRRVLPDTPPF